jgi:hypothetical protein
MKASDIQTMAYEKCRSILDLRYVDFAEELGILTIDPYFFSLHFSPNSAGCFSQ